MHKQPDCHDFSVQGAHCTLHGLIGGRTIVATTLAPTAQIVSKKLGSKTNLSIKRLTLQDFEFVSVFLVMANLPNFLDTKSRRLRRTTKTSTAAGFAPTPTTEARVMMNLTLGIENFKCNAGADCLRVPRQTYVLLISVLDASRPRRGASCNYLFLLGDLVEPGGIEPPTS